MAIAVVQAGAQVTGNTSTASLTITPACAAASSTSVMILVVYLNYGALTGQSITTPVGWTANLQNLGTGGLLKTFWRTGFTGTSQAVTMAATGGTYYGAAALIELSGANTSTAFTLIANKTSGAVASTPQTISGTAINPTANNGMFFGIWGWNDTGADAHGNTVQSGWTEDINGTNLSNTDAASIYVAHFATPTTTGSPQTPTLQVMNASFISPNFQCTSIIANVGTGGSIWPPPNLLGGAQLLNGGVTQ